MHSTAKLAASVLFWALLLHGCADGAPGGQSSGPQACREDRDCPTNLVCTDGFCGSQLCQSSQECAFGSDCIQGICEEVEGYCNRNSDCLNGDLCDRDRRRCVPADQAQRPCTGDDQCFADERCEQGYCTLIDTAEPEPEPDLPQEDLSAPEPEPDLPIEEDLFEPEPEPDLPQEEDLFEPEPEPEPDLPEEDLVVLEPEPDLPPEDMPPEDMPPEDMPPEDMTPDVPEEDTPPEDMPQEDTPPEDMPEPDLPPEDMTPEDMLADVPEDMPADVGEDLPPEEDMAEDMVAVEPDIFEPPPTPQRGFYDFRRLEVGGLVGLQTVAFHPGGQLAVALGIYDNIYLINWETDEVTTLTPPPTSGYRYSFQDIAMDPSGDFALIVGLEYRRSQSSTTQGVILRLDLAGGAAEIDPATALTRYDLTLYDAIYDILYPWDGGLPILLADQDIGNSHIVTLRNFDPGTGTYGDLFTRLNSGTDACRHMAYTTNEFGRAGLFLSCNFTLLYHTTVGDVPEWRQGRELGTTNLGNTFGTTEHRPGDYALMFSSFSDRKVWRFRNGLLDSSRMSLSTHSPSMAAFQQEGQRALLIGDSSGRLLEYRHGTWDGCVSNPYDCLTDNSINLSAPPYSVSNPSRVYSTGAAWRPGCDGGYLVTNNTDNGSGMIIEFSILGARPCR